MQFSLETKTVSLSVGEFAGFSLGPQDAGGGPQGLWRAQLGQHWHNELQKRTLAESPAARFEVVIDGRLTHRGWTFALTGRIDQIVGDTLREIKSVMRPLPADETALRTDYPDYFRQLAMYMILTRVGSANPTPGPVTATPRRWAELVFVEAGSGLSQTIALTPFDEALVHHQLDAMVEFLNLRMRATERRRALIFQPAFPSLRAGQETIQQDLQAAFLPTIRDPAGRERARSSDKPRPESTPERGRSPSPVLLFEAPTGYGKTGCVLEFALGQLRAGRFARLIWLTGKSTGQLQVVHTLQQITTPDTCNLLGYKLPLGYWQVRNKSEHCVNHTFHCVRDGCDYLRDCGERWPGSGLAKFYLDDAQPRDLGTVRAAGQEARICPYEITRTALAFNDVWIGDFNYVFAPDNRGLFFEQPGFDPAETLLIIDEAHNLPSRVAGAHSHRATCSAAQLLLAELDHLRAPAPLVLAVEEWTRLLASLRPADSLDPVTEAEVHDHVAKLTELITTQSLDYAALGPRHSETLWQFAALDEFLADRQLTKLLWVARAGELEFTCVDAAPSIGETLEAFGGAILMSATLQPYAEFATSCDLTKPATLHAPTPWRAGAYDVAVDLRVETTFKQRANYYGTTAATVETLHRAASGTVAVFFPSYAYAEAVLRAVDHIGSVIKVALQPRLPDLTAQTAWIEENVVFADALFLVLGSSFAEGIDLLGGKVTHAMVVGPALPEVNAVQKARLDALSGLGRDAAFRRVYQIPGLQKVNQALGRLVRAPGQKAKVLLHCKRFADPSYASLLATDYQMYTEIASETELRDWLGGVP